MEGSRVEAGEAAEGSRVEASRVEAREAGEIAQRLPEILIRAGPRTTMKMTGKRQNSTGNSNFTVTF
ncbi:hypothetical protein Abr02nite_83060 [Paractinoplanes brasiliensis]|nr:hypothetical protein Abr02nite_83060 [Actinoplanes brasiliensis]